MSQEALFDEPVICGMCKKPEPRDWCWAGRTNDCPLGYKPRWDLERQAVYNPVEARNRYQNIPINTDHANARRTDPITSHEAAASIKSDAIRRSQEAVLGMLKRYGPMHDQQLIERYLYYARIDSDMPAQSESGIRTRRKELVTKELVEDTGRTIVLESGRKSIIWKATT